MDVDAYIGEIRTFAGKYIPEGWQACDGSLLPVSAYPALFALIGTTYGGNGQTDFAVPDLRGRVVVGQGVATTNTKYPLGKTGGSEAVTLTAVNLPVHSHAMNVATDAATAYAPDDTLMVATSPAPPPALNLYTTTNSVTTPGTMGASTVGQSGQVSPMGHNNVSSSLVVTYILCAIGGIFPTTN